MKKRGTFSNIIGFLLAAVVVFAGIATPTVLLSKQEKTLIGEIKYAVTAGRDPVSVIPARADNPNSFDASVPMITSMPSPMPTPAPTVFISGITADELYARLRVWGMDGYKTVRDPFDYELSMERAVEKVRAEIGKFADRNALPAVIWSDYHFSSAQLSANSIPLPTGDDKKEVNGVTIPANLGRWIIAFDDGTEGNKLIVSCDAQTGTIYEVNFTGAPSAVISPRGDELSAFVSYFGLNEKDSPARTASPASTAAVSTVWTFDRFHLSYESTNTNSYTISIHINT